MAKKKKDTGVQASIPDHPETDKFNTIVMGSKFPTETEIRKLKRESRVGDNIQQGEQEKESITLQQLGEIDEDLKDHIKRGSKAGRIDDSDKIEEWLFNYAEWRFNTLNGNVEYRNDETDHKWKAASNYLYNSLIRRIQKELNEKRSAAAVKTILESEFSEKIDPILDYFELLPEWKEGDTDYIEELSGSLDTKHPHRDEFFKKWIVATAANVFERKKCDNQIMLLLRGDQGCYKSTFINMLCPEAIDDYIYSGIVDTSAKAAKENNPLLVQNFIVNFDDCVAMNIKNHMEETKGFITRERVRYRAPYEKSMETWPRSASICGTMNEDEVFYERENRRFLLFDLTGINHAFAKGIPMDMVWSQAKALYQSKEFRYWFNDDDRARLQKVNADFMVVSREEQMIEKHFIFLEDGEKPTGKGWSLLPSGEIESQLQRLEPTFRSSPALIGRALSRMGIKKEERRIDGKRCKGYFLRIKDSEKVNNQYAYEAKIKKEKIESAIDKANRIAAELV
jgi:predicted P-loop ATPase